MNLKKRLVPAKCYLEVHEKKKQIARELSLIEKTRISLPELDRRILNIGRLKEVLKRDAEIKWRMGKK